MTSTSTEVEPAPVFVDQTGQRGRRLRGFGWLVGILCTGCVVAMISGLVGTQSRAPAMKIPGTANTTPPGQYLDAPLPAAPGAAGPGKGTTATAAGSDDIASDPASTADGTAASDATASATATTTDGTAAADSATVTAQ
ncbi:hypothetical protein [Streptomyces adustus]